MTDPRQPAVLFVCQTNGGKSQMAAGLMRLVAGEEVEISSAGTKAGGSLNALSAEVLLDLGADIRTEHPTQLTEEAMRQAGHVVILGTNAQVDPVDGVTVERCGSCVGFFLEAGELEAFTGRALPALQLAARDGQNARMQPATPASLEFACSGCGKRLTRSTGLPSRGGLTCVACAPQVHPVVEPESHALEVFEVPLELLGGILEVFDW